MMRKSGTIVFVVRHGETEWNLIGKQQGHLDSPLTETGVRQARRLADGLVGRGIDSIFASDLGRAAETAKIISSKLRISIKTDLRLRERHLGLMQGLTKDEFKKTHPSEWVAFSSGDPDYRFPGGESARERFERNVACIEELARNNDGRTILVVAHGGVLYSIFHHATGIPLSEPRMFSLMNAAINRFSFIDDSWRIDTWGETAHLAEIIALDDN